MRILTATLWTETNTFSPMATGMAAFQEMGIFHRHTEPLPETRFTKAALLWRILGEADGHQVVHSLVAAALPAGTTVRAVYESFREEILHDVIEAGPFDVVLLYLHGAMVAEGYNDCEGDLLSRLRERVGSAVKIGIELDPHCHLTDLMLSKADVIVLYKEYPHTDILDRAKELYRITTDAAEGKVAPAMATADLPIVNIWSTAVQPMRGFVDRLMQREGHDGVLSLSFAHGFPWGDAPPGVARPLAIVDRDVAKAGRVAQEMADELWAMREATAFKALSIDQAFDEAAKTETGLIVIADAADNTGGGAPGDSTFVLRRALERGVKDIAIGPLWDPIAVQFCKNAGAGALIDLRIGGKCGPSSGLPVDARVTVHTYLEEHTQMSSFGGGGVIPLGAAAWVEVNGVHIVLCSLRMQCFAPSAFTGLGLPLEKMHIVIPKSTNHFRADFEPIATAILYLEGPGAIAADFANLKFNNRTNNFWPRVADPSPDKFRTNDSE
jgi:microcystin degradation protein MlrC